MTRNNKAYQRSPYDLGQGRARGYGHITKFPTRRKGPNTQGFGVTSIFQPKNSRFSGTYQAKFRFLGHILLKLSKNKIILAKCQGYWEKTEGFWQKNSMIPIKKLNATESGDTV